MEGIDCGSGGGQNGAGKKNGEKGGTTVTEQQKKKWFADCVGIIDILAKQCFAVGLSYALELEDV